MEENKIDPYQIIGFVLLIAAFFWWFNYTIPELEKNSLESDKIEKATGVSTDEIKIKTQNPLGKNSKTCQKDLIKLKPE